MSRRKTKEEVNQQLVGRNVSLVGDYHGAHVMTQFLCDQGHIFLAKTNRILNGGGCTECSPTKPLSKDIVNERLARAGRPIQLIGDYINNSTKTKFLCMGGHEWLSKTDNVLNGSGCPSCATHGFDINKPTYIYILAFDYFLKYGVTFDLKARLRAHRMVGDYRIVETMLLSDGRIALDWENLIRDTLGHRFVTKDIMPNGFTETLPIGKLEELLALTIKHKETTWEK
jgi:hypothetical protein